MFSTLEISHIFAALGDIMTPAVIGAGVAIVLGVVILFVFRVFAVPVDERAEKLTGMLPGANCGGCGYSGCSGYAEALVAGTETDTNKCTAGGAETAEEVAAFFGKEAGVFIPKVAHVYCQGSRVYTERRYDYTGTSNCASAAGLFAGPWSCTYGCVGMGDCVAACNYHAIYVENGVARVNQENCVACGQCVEACPKGLIKMIPKHEAATVCTCSNHWPGARIRKGCSIGCIGCRMCVKKCPVNAISMDDNLAVIDQEVCIHCGLCATVCPTKAIRQGLNGAPGTHEESEGAKPLVKKQDIAS